MRILQAINLPCYENHWKNHLLDSRPKFPPAGDDWLTEWEAYHTALLSQAGDTRRYSIKD